jgi:hypothetical protein
MLHPMQLEPLRIRDAVRSTAGVGDDPRRVPAAERAEPMLLVPDGVFVDDEDRLAFVLHPVPTSEDVMAILDRIVRRIARRLADGADDDSHMEEAADVLAQV